MASRAGRAVLALDERGDAALTTDFFVPDAPADQAVEVYGRLAELSHLAVPPPAERIRAITFDHDGVTWTAEVGKHLRGVRHVRKKVNGSWTYREVTVPSGTTVAAIFESVPFHVWHTGGRSEWANPFYAGNPRGIRQFG